MTSCHPPGEPEPDSFQVRILDAPRGGAVVETTTTRRKP